VLGPDLMRSPLTDGVAVPEIHGTYVTACGAGPAADADSTPSPTAPPAARAVAKVNVTARFLMLIQALLIRSGRIRLRPFAAIRSPPGPRVPERAAERAIVLMGASPSLVDGRRGRGDRTSGSPHFHSLTCEEKQFVRDVM
jgi:hypothetical protein